MIVSNINNQSLTSDEMTVANTMAVCRLPVNRRQSSNPHISTRLLRRKAVKANAFLKPYVTVNNTARENHFMNKKHNLRKRKPRTVTQLQRLLTKLKPVAIMEYTADAMRQFMTCTKSQVPGTEGK